MDYKLVDQKTNSCIRIALKYDSITKNSAIKSLTRASKPGLRKYSPSSELPRVLNGMGVSILPTTTFLLKLGCLPPISSATFSVSRTVRRGSLPFRSTFVLAAAVSLVHYGLIE